LITESTTYLDPARLFPLFDLPMSCDLEPAAGNIATRRDASGQ
jgi:hypothetical protein